MSRKWFPLILISLGMLIVGLGLVYALYLRSMESIAPVPLPDELGGLPLRREVTGSSALVELSMLHSQGFPLNKGSAGSYGNHGEIRIWVAGTPIGFMAGGLMTAMKDAIERGDSPFSPLGELEIQGRTVYELEGMGQQHYCFRSGDLIVWVAVDDSLTEQVLKSVLEFYP
jgi:hypothetical protein